MWKVFQSPVVMVVLLAMQPAGLSSPKPDLVLRSQFTGRDHQTYRELPFDVPAGVIRVTVNFSYTGREERTVLDVGLWDGERFRGWSGGNKSFFTVSATDATPSYLAGPVRPGRWHLLVGVPNIRRDSHAAFTAEVFFARAGDVPEISTFSAAPLRTEPGWYRGDLHMHTAHSDGSCLSQSGQRVPCPLFRTVEAAAARHLDFIAITDHNTTSHFAELRELQPYFDRLLLIPGREITTFEGHANVFGPVEFLDFRLTGKSLPNAGALIDEVNKVHGLISLNHPGSASGESCMGCGWTAPDTDFARIDAVEVVNGGKAGGIPFWEAQLNRGVRWTAIGGSDNHNADLAASDPGSVGWPTTVVYAEDLSERSILNGIRSGKVFIDTEGTRDRLLEYSRLPAPAGGPITISIHSVAVRNGTLEVIQDGKPVAAFANSRIESDDDTRQFSLEGDGKRHWLRIAVHAADGHLLLMGNPVYINW